MLVYISLPWYPASPFLGPAFLAKLQEKPSPPQLLPYNPPHVLAALKSCSVKRKAPELSHLLVEGFASGKSSGSRVPWYLGYVNFVNLKFAYM